MSVGNTNLVYGWGINDSGYPVTKNLKVDGKSKRVWTCPYYAKWSSMIKRCFLLEAQEKRPTYKGCTIHEDWKYFSNFIKWVDSQPNKDWQNCSLDKDFLVEGNKHYGPDTVVFISASVNNFIVSCKKARGNSLIGVCYSPNASKKNPYRAKCCNPFTGKGEHLGSFPTEMEAHLAWKSRKHSIALQLADTVEDLRVVKRLREMYSSDKDWTKA